MPPPHPLSPDPSFIPRAEFQKGPVRTTSVFALLSFSGPNLLRLTRFPDPVLNALRRLFGDQLTAFREVVLHGLAEFTLDGRPWANPKTVHSEQLVVEILAVLFFYGYRFMSAIDFGREPDDRLCLAFSRPWQQPLAVPQSSPSPNLSPAHVLPLPGPVEVPFALSFSSTSLVRVISPPLHLTPAVLQAVRSSWPRGIASEKKLSDNSYEFKLKGYKWFQEDTYATDSLQLILSLLNALDVHGFTLLTSCCLGSRSRVKDLWIFTGSQSPDAPSASASSPTVLEPSISRTRFSREHLIPLLPLDEATTSNHLRSATTPDPTIAVGETGIVHARAYTDSPSRFSSDPALAGPNVLRKPAPRAQVPLSVLSAETLSPHQEEVNLDVVDMTGVGSARNREHLAMQARANVIYRTGDYETRGRPVEMPRRRSSLPSMTSYPSQSTEDETRSRSVSRGRPPLHSHDSMVAIAAIAAATIGGRSASTDKEHRSVELSPFVGSPAESDQRTPPLLGSQVFRDSAFSSNTKQSFEIPISWTGPEPPPISLSTRVEPDRDAGHFPLSVAALGIPGPEGSKVTDAATPYDSSLSSVGPATKGTFAIAEALHSVRPELGERLSTGPVLPGGWIASPVEEEEGPSGPSETTHSTRSEDLTLPEHREVGARVIAAEITATQNPGARRSEAAVIGMMAAPESSPGEQEISQPKKGTGEGWVLVNVEGERKPAGSPTASRAASPARGHTSVPSSASAPDQDHSQETSSSIDRPSTPSNSHGTNSRQDSRVRVDSVTVARSSPTVLKHLFSVPKSKGSISGTLGKTKTIDVEENEPAKEKGKKRLFSRKRTGSAVEATRREKRVNVD